MSHNCQGSTVVAAVLLALLAVAGCSGRASSPTLVLATTTSVANSGLLDALSQAYRGQTRTVIRAHLVGSGLALRMLEKGDVDVAISHAPQTEAQFLTAHANWTYRKIMYNDFVLVGPPSDPADVKGEKRASDAMRRIAELQVKFISRGDGSGTHEREEQLWQSAGRRPDASRLVAAGSSMGTTLRIASETGAYTLTDRATLAQYSGALSLVIVFEGDNRELLNTYGVIVDRTGPQANEAERFSTWLADGAGRQVIGAYRIRGVPVFHAWPSAASRGHPQDQPRNE
jgi:tungstate transport system substrate-binding protein